ncbi:hypothetical protein ACVNF4_15540 [Streptomyces sp. S6]
MPGTTLFRQLLQQRHLTTHEAFAPQYRRAAVRLAELDRDARLASLEVSPRQFDRWYGGELLTLPRPDACRVSTLLGEGLDAAYPLGGFLTHLLLHGDPRKIVLAHSSVTVDSGNHRAEGHRPTNRPPVVVHHFKWRRGVREDLERRAARTADGSWQTKSPALLSEARHLLNHLSLHDGRIDVTSPDVPFRPVTLQETPPWWPQEAIRLAATWHPARRSPAR